MARTIPSRGVFDLGKFVIVQRLYLAHAPRLSRRPPRAFFLIFSSGGGSIDGGINGDKMKKMRADAGTREHMRFTSTALFERQPRALCMAISLAAPSYLSCEHDTSAGGSNIKSKLMRASRCACHRLSAGTRE